MDLLVVSTYICLVFIIAYRARVKSGLKSLKTQYLADRSLSFSESLFSIVATEVSALTFIGIPAFSYTKDFSFIYIYFGAIIGRLLIAQLILPQIYSEGVTLYEVIAKKRGSSYESRSLLSLIYIVSRVLAVGVRLYAGSILVGEFFEVSIFTAVIMTSVLTYLYTLIGGLKAVVRTDRLQMITFILGGFCAHYIISQQAQMPWSDLMFLAYSNGKIAAGTSIDIWSNLLIGVIGGALFDIATHGMDQDFVQRLLACKSLKTAQKSIIYSSLLSIFVGLLFLSVGALLWSHYSLIGFPMLENNDKIFAHFIMNEFPLSLRGLMLAGVLAATMSTLDSTINAVGSCLSNDIFKRNDSDINSQKIFTDGAIIMFALLLVAFMASRFTGVLELGLKISSWIGGGLLGVYISQMSERFFAEKLSIRLIIFIFMGNIAFVSFNTFLIKGPWQLNIYWGTLGAILCMWLFGKERERSN